jgi:hypothetical protein
VASRHFERQLQPSRRRGPVPDGTERRVWSDSQRFLRYLGKLPTRPGDGSAATAQRPAIFRHGAASSTACRCPFSYVISVAESRARISPRKRSIALAWRVSRVISLNRAPRP